MESARTVEERVLQREDSEKEVKILNSHITYRGQRVHCGDGDASVNEAKIFGI